MSLIGFFLRPMIGKRRFQKIYQKLFIYSLRGMNIGQGGHPNSSGEREALIYLKERLGVTPVLFDVGANIGDYSILLRELFPEGEIHCFEPAKSTYEKMNKDVSDYKTHKNNLGLGEKKGVMELLYDVECSDHASFYDNKDSDFALKESVSVTTVDDYCNEKNIRCIDYLKMDVEGSEYRVLLGASNMLKEGKIKAIQLEFGQPSVFSRVFFRDYWDLLSGQYDVYRIVKDGLFRIAEYDITLEIFSCTNYVFLFKGCAN